MISDWIDTTLNVKYRAEISCQEYRAEIDNFNKALDQAEIDYKPLLQNLESNEESRINFVKYSMEKSLKMFE